MAAHVLRETVCVCARTCVGRRVPCSECASVDICVLQQHFASICILACSCTALSTTSHVVSHFELLLSDSYRLEVCVCAEASKQHLALCIPLEIVTLEYPRRMQHQYSMYLASETHSSSNICVHLCVGGCVFVFSKCVECDVLNWAPHCFLTLQLSHNLMEFFPVQWLTEDLCIE